MQDFLPGMENAAQRARALDTHPEERWPRSPGSWVHLLVEKMMADAEGR